MKKTRVSKPPVYEYEIENECTDLVTDLGGVHRKLDTGRGAKGQLDHAYWLPNGWHMIVEFKVPGKKPTPLQRRKIEKLRALGHEVHVIDNVEDFRGLLGKTEKENV